VGYFPQILDGECPWFVIRKNFLLAFTLEVGLNQTNQGSNDVSSTGVEGDADFAADRLPDESKSAAE
jgi:hypothetical protein